MGVSGHSSLHMHLTFGDFTANKVKAGNQSAFHQNENRLEFYSAII